MMWACILFCFVTCDWFALGGWLLLDFNCLCCLFALGNVYYLILICILVLFDY